MSRLFKVMCLMAIAGLASATPSWGEINQHWAGTGASQEFGVPTNWDVVADINGNRLFSNSVDPAAYPILSNGGTYKVWDLFIGREDNGWNSHGPGRFMQQGGVINLNYAFDIGNNSIGTSTFDMTGGTINKALDGGDPTIGGGNAATIGILNMSGNATINTYYNWSWLGRFGGTGYMTMTGNATWANHNGDFRIGNDGGTGQVDMTGHSKLDIQGGVFVGADQAGGGTGTINMGPDATFIVNGDLSVGSNNNLSHGTIATSGTVEHRWGGSIFIGRSGGDGKWTQSGGQTLNNGGTFLGEGDTGTATLNLDGGLFTTAFIHPYDVGAPTSTLVFNGATVKATSNDDGFIRGATTGGTFTALVKSPGAIIDSNGFNVGVQTGLLADTGSTGGLTKLGLGTLTLSGANTYTGDTVIQKGRLNLNTGCTFLPGSKIVMQNNTTLGGSATATGADVTANAGFTIDPTPLTWGVALGIHNLTVNANAKMISRVDLSSTTDPKLGSFSVNDVSASASGTIIGVGIQGVGGAALNDLYGSPTTVITYGSKGGTTGIAPTFRPTYDNFGTIEPTVTDAANTVSITLNPTPAGTRGWVSGTNWSTSTWSEGTAPSTSNDRAWLDDTAVGGVGTPSAVTLDTPVTLSSMLFNTASGTGYTINKAATTPPAITLHSTIALDAQIQVLAGTQVVNPDIKLAGIPLITVATDSHLTLGGILSNEVSDQAAGLSVTGGGTLNLTNAANTYTGSTSIDGTTVVISALAPAGSASSIGAAPADAANFSIGNAMLTYTGGTVATNRGMTITGPTTLNVQNGTVAATVTLSGSILNSGGSLTTAGNGSLVFTNPGTTTLAQAGMAITNAAVTLDGGANATYEVGGTYNPAVDGTDQFALATGYNGSTSALTLNSGTLNVANSQFTVAAGAGSTGTFTVNGGTLNVFNGETAFGNNGGNATIIQTGGTINTNNWVGVGRHWPPELDVGTVTTYEMSGGVFNKNGGGDMEVGQRGHVDGSGTINVQGYGTLNMSNDAQINVYRGVFTIGKGLGANGKVTMTDNASLNVTSNVLIVGNEGGKGELDLAGGTITCNEFWVGQYFGNIDVTATRVRSEGVFTMDSGTVNVHNWFVVGRDRAIGTFTMNGGTVNKNTAAGSTWGNVIVSSIGGIGTFDMNGGTFYNNSHLALGESNGDDLGNATFNLNGGMIQASAVRRFSDNATGNLNFNGGVLQVSDTEGNRDYGWCGPVWLHSHYLATSAATVQTGGAKIDTNGYVIGINQPLVSGAATDGGLTKQGAGSLYLATTPSYNGLTTVSNGSLVLDRSNLPGAVKIEAGGTLRMSNPSGLTGYYYNSEPPNPPITTGDGQNVPLSAVNTVLGSVTADLIQNSRTVGSFFDFGNNGQYFPSVGNANHEHFTSIWTGSFHATVEGTYDFATISDDGSMIWLDNVETAVVNNNWWQGNTRRTGSVYLTAGDHPITIAYYQGGGGYGMWAEVKQPGQNWQYIANDMLSSADPLTAQAFSIGSLSGTGGTLDLGGALNTLTVNQTTAETFAGAVTGSGTMVKDGSAKLTLTQDVSFTGNLVVNHGDMDAQGISTTGNVSVLGTSVLNAKSIVADTLTIGGTPIAASSAAVPEPGTLVLLALAGLALAGAYLRRK